MSMFTVDAAACAGSVVCWLDQHEGLGVWAGSGASLLVAVVAVGVVFLQRHLERRARLRSLSLSALFKMRAIHSTMLGLVKTLERWKSRGKEFGLAEPFQYMEPVSNPPDQIKFSADETEALFLLGDGKLFDEIQLMEMYHNSALALLERCTTRRMALTDLLPAEMRGTVGTVELTQELLRITGPRAAEIAGMMVSMEKHWEPDAAAAGELLHRLNRRLKAKLGLNVPLEPAPGMNVTGTD
jgi:hypothetical protein